MIVIIIIIAIITNIALSTIIAINTNIAINNMVSMMTACFFIDAQAGQHAETATHALWENFCAQVASSPQFASMIAPS